MYNDNEPKVFGSPEPQTESKAKYVAETWEGDERPGFLVRTDKMYARHPYISLADRGIENRLLDSLILALPEGTIIAGGFMTSVMQEDKNAKDIDLFFTSEEAFIKAVQWLSNPETMDGYCKDEHWAIDGYELDPGTDPCETKALLHQDLIIRKPVLKNTRFLKFNHKEGKRPPIQLIKLVWYDNAEHVIDSFDLTIAQFALDCKTGELVFNPLSVLDLARKRIVLHRMQFPASTLRRVIKYTQKGYYACPGSLVKITEEISKSYKEGQEQIVYVD